MAKQNTKKPNKAKYRRGSGEGAKIVALLVFILIGLGVIAGSVWYYGFFQPQAQKDIKETSVAFAKDFFSVDFNTITGKEGEQYMTAANAEAALASGRVNAWKEQELAITLQGEIEVSILRQGYRSATARAVFWQHEVVKDEGKDYLIYYDLDFTYDKGRWLVSKVRVADPEELRTLRLNKGVLEEQPGESQ